MAFKSISPEFKKEADQITITGFAKNVGIQSITWNEDYQRIVVDYYKEDGSTARENYYDKNVSKANWKTAESKAKAIQYQINAFARLCQAVKPDLQLVDTSDLKTAYEEYVSQIDELLPSACNGELKMNFKEVEGKYFNFKVSRDLPVYTNPTKPNGVKFTDNDKALLSFKIVEPKPDVEEEGTNQPF